MTEIVRLANVVSFLFIPKNMIEYPKQTFPAISWCNKYKLRLHRKKLNLYSDQNQILLTATFSCDVSSVYFEEKN